MTISALLSSERRISTVLALALLPWVLVAMFAAGLWVALDLVAYAILTFLAGYALVCATLPAKARACAIVLAPSAGVLALSALTTFWLRLGLPLLWVSVVWFGLAVVGTIGSWHDRGQLEKATADYGIALVLLSALICAFYFIPGAFNDAVLRHDGGYTWLNIDTQLNHSWVESIRNSEGPPKMAGTSTAELCYHFGPYSLAAAISRFTGIDAGDALVRVTRGVEQWTLVFSCFGLGTMLSLRATARTFGGLMSVAGLFFYGSMLSLFSGVVRPRLVATWPILFEAGGQFPTNGGIFSHILLGTSMLQSSEAVTAILGLCLAQRTMEGVSSWRKLTAMLLPAFMATVHSAGGLYCLGAVAVLLFWGHLDSVRSWFLIAVMLGLFLGACKLMGYFHSAHVAGAGIQFNRLPIYWWSFVIWFSVALGIRVISFGWVTQPSKSPLAMLLLVSFVGLLSFSWVGALWAGAEHYGIYYLQVIFSIFAFSRLPEGFWRVDARERWVTEWLSLTKKGLLFFTILGVLIGIFQIANHGKSGISYFRFRILSCFLFLSLLAILLAILKRSRRFSAAVSAIIASALLFGFLGWIPPWLKYRTSGQSYNVTLTSGEVRGLQRLREVATQGERFATNKHTPTGGISESSADSYAYGTLSGLPVLLEGSADGAEDKLPGFATLLHDNDLLFTTNDPVELREIARSYRVRWLVGRPSTDISLPRPLPAWLVEQQDSGDLKIYRID